MGREKENLEELYREDVGLKKFADQCTSIYRKVSVGASRKLRDFIEKYNKTLKKTENFLEVVFPAYMGVAALDFINTYVNLAPTNDPSLEVTENIRNAMEFYGIGNGLLMTAFTDLAFLWLLYKGSYYIEKLARKSTLGVNELPLIRKLIPYAYAIGCGIKHYLAYTC